jgi:hypothetical protein
MAREKSVNSREFANSYSCPPDAGQAVKAQNDSDSEAPPPGRLAQARFGGSLGAIRLPRASLGLERSRTRVAFPRNEDGRLAGSALAAMDSDAQVRPMGAPPVKHSKRDQYDSDEKYEQSRIGDPGDERHRKRKESPHDAELPGSQVKP